LQKNVLEYLENSAKLYPKKVAFIDEKNSYTFLEIKTLSQKLAVSIKLQLSTFNSPIAIFVDRNVDSLIGFFGILYSGNYYVPIDNKMPSSRIKNILDRLNPALIIYQAQDEAIIKEFNKYNSLKLDIQNLDKEINEKLIKENLDKILDIDPAYVIFTSGSTGIPKGIVIPHKNIIDFIDWMEKACNINETNIMGNQAPFYFDLSVKDIYLTLKCHSTTYILSRKMLMFPSILIDTLNDNSVNTLIWATSAFHLVANSKIFEKKTIKNLSKVILGGEALNAKQLNIWKNAMPNTTYINLYGPTEVTVDCTYYIIDKEFKDYEEIPIGKACENMQILLLDENLNQVSKGEIGEICVRGTGISKGYFGDFEKTNSSFIQNPLNKNFPDIIYKTGDLGRIKEDGLIYFENRKDFQIKHNGYRIELGEIERAINSFNKLKISACIFDKNLDKIVCFFEGNTDEKDILEHIKDLIPKYMFPNIFIKVEKMPYNKNTKIDRVKLNDIYANY